MDYILFLSSRNMRLGFPSFFCNLRLSQRFYCIIKIVLIINEIYIVKGSRDIDLHLLYVFRNTVNLQTKLHYQFQKMHSLASFSLEKTPIESG